MEPVQGLPENRILNAVILHTEQEAQYRVDNPASHRKDPYNLNLQKKHYEAVLLESRNMKKLTPEERNALRYVRHEIRRLNAQLEPNLWKTILYNDLINRMFNFLLGRQANYSNHGQILKSYEKATVLETNFTNIQKSMRDLGFQGNIEQILKKWMASNLSEFSLRHTEPNSPKTEFVLHFKKLPGTDAYYFNNFDAISRPTPESILKNDPNNPRMNFSIIGGIQFTAQEAAQLTNGRPIQKDVNGEKMWYTQDATSPNGLRQKSFDLEGALSEWKIKEMQNPSERKVLLNALTSGNQKPVTLLLPNGHEQKVYVKVAWNVDQLAFSNKEGQFVDAHNLVKQNAKVIKIAEALKLKKNTPKPVKNAKAR